MVGDKDSNMSSDIVLVIPDNLEFILTEFLPESVIRYSKIIPQIKRLQPLITPIGQEDENDFKIGQKVEGLRGTMCGILGPGNILQQQT